MLQAPGVHATTVTQPGFFRPYLLEQLWPLVEEYGASLSVQASDHPDAYIRRMLVNEYLSWRRKWARLIPHADVGIRLVDERGDCLLAISTSGIDTGSSRVCLVTGSKAIALSVWPDV